MNVTWQQAGGGGLLPRGGPGASTPVLGRVPAVMRYAAGDVDIILATIRQMESGGRYAIGPNRGGASGAYQFVRSTWNGYAGYPEAYLAPPQVQDQRARADVEMFLARFDGNAAMVPVMWYFPLAARDAAWMDRVPMPSAGNTLTVRQYQRRWMELFNSKRAAVTGEVTEQAAVTVLPEMPVATPEDATDPAATVETTPPAEGGVSAETMASAARSVPVGELPPHGAGSMRSIAFPVLGPVTYHNGWGDCRDGCERHHEGTDMIGVRMQPVLAAVDGTVTRVDFDNPGIAGAAVTIRDADGWRYNYFHLNNDTPGSDDGQAVPAWQAPPRLEVGDRVKAGQIIGYMGDSGNSEFSVPHLHFEIRDPSGAARPSFWSLEAAKARQACSIGIGPWSFPEPPAAPVADPAGDPAVEAVASAGVEMTEVVPLFGSGTWLIDTEGRVTATGDAALIVPSRTMSCQPGPLVPFGADGAGWATTVDASIIDGTALATADQEYLAAVGIHPDRDSGTEGAERDTASADQTAAPTASAYLDPSTGELVLVPAGAVPAPPPVPEPEPVVAPRPLAGFQPRAV